MKMMACPQRWSMVLGNFIALAVVGVAAFVLGALACLALPGWEVWQAPSSGEMGAYFLACYFLLDCAGYRTAGIGPGDKNKERK